MLATARMPVTPSTITFSASHLALLIGITEIARSHGSGWFDRIGHCRISKSLQPPARCLGGLRRGNPFELRSIQSKTERSMHSVFETAPATPAIPVTFATKATWDATCAELPAPARQFALANGFAAKPGACLTLPSANGQIAQVVFGLENETGKFRDLFRPGLLPGLLPPGVYRFANAPHDIRLAVLAFALGSYRFSRYRKGDAPGVRLLPPDGIDVATVTRTAKAAALARDLINTPANDMGPEELAQAAQHLAKRFGASFSCIVGDGLRRKIFPPLL